MCIDVWSLLTSNQLLQKQYLAPKMDNNYLNTINTEKVNQEFLKMNDIGDKNE